MGFFGRLAEGLKKTRDSMAQKMDAIVNSFTKIDEDLFEELEETLTEIGRRFRGGLDLRHRIKRADRLLGNAHLQRDAKGIYAALARQLLAGRGWQLRDVTAA